MKKRRVDESQEVDQEEEDYHIGYGKPPVH